MTKRAASAADLRDIALSLPGVTEGMSWGDMPSYQVLGKAFVLFRPPRPDALDEQTGERLQDVILFRVPDRADKEALVQSAGPWFTTAHFDGYNAVLLRAAHLGELTREELTEVVVDAWLTRAPARLAREWLAEHRPG